MPQLQVEFFCERILKFVRPAAARAAALVAPTRRHWRHRPSRGRGGTGKPATLADSDPGAPDRHPRFPRLLKITLKIMTLSMIDSNLASDIFSDTLVNNTVTIIMIRSGAGYRSSDSESSAARASLSHDW